MSAGAYAQQGPIDGETEYSALVFVIQQMLNKLAGPTLVKVISCTNAGGLSAQGTVSVQPLVNQMTGNRQAVPHGVITSLPYQRIQGGANAVIMDPQPGDIGLACFASRDISSVKATKAQANPSSERTFDWADGLYLYSFLGGVPTQYFQFTDQGITAVSPTQITLQAPNISLNASSGIAIASPANAISGGGTSIDGKAFLPHLHTGVQTGGGDTGPVA